MLSSNIKILIAAIMCIIIGIIGSVSICTTTYHITRKMENVQHQAEDFIHYELKPLRGNIND